MLRLLSRLQKYHTIIISIHGTKLNAAVADSFLKRMIGLMFRKHLPRNSCMLFVFNIEGFHGIWMRNMLFPIDVLWINKRMRVVDLKENLRPCTSTFDCATYSPAKKSKYILELNAGKIKELNIKTGRIITLKKIKN